MGQSLTKYHRTIEGLLKAANTGDADFVRKVKTPDVSPPSLACVALVTMAERYRLGSTAFTLSSSSELRSLLVLSKSQ